jgi:tetratricopeptide (TPR) repeat protein
MNTRDRYTTADVQRILSVSAKQLNQWDRLHLVSPQEEQGKSYYDFRDLIGLRTVKQLIDKGVPAKRLGRAVAALRQGLSQVESPLNELRVMSDGKDVIIERGGSRLDPLSGQFVLNFETRDLDEGVQVITQRSADDWFAVALECEAQRRPRAEAIDAYERALRMDASRVDALLNCGALYYEESELDKAAEYFRRAIAAHPENALAHFNLGSVLEEMGELENARRHLAQSVQFDPTYPDAHYNLAFVCEKLGALTEARRHWRGYLDRDPTGPWADYARQRLAAKSSSARRQ